MKIRYGAKVGEVVDAAAQSVDSLDDDYIEKTGFGVFQQTLIFVPKDARARDGCIGIDRNHFPSVFVGQSTALHNLIGDRFRSLVL